MHNRSLARAGALTLGAALLLTGCGASDDRTGPQVAADAADALEEAGSAHVVATFAQDGEEQELDLHLQGEDATGSITMAGQEIQLLMTGGEVYAQAPAEFWAAFGLPEELMATFDGKWVLMPAEAASEFGTVTLEGLAAELREPSDGEIEEEVAEDELDGEDVLVVSQENGSTLTVQAGDTSYPLRIENSAEGEGTMELSRFGETEEISAPEDAIDLTQLGA
jgi:hypothetical protein